MPPHGRPIFETLVDERVLAPVGVDPREERLWLDCDLASLAELRLEERIDPRTMTAGVRAALEPRATREREMPLERRRELEEPLWILDGDRKAGTIALTRGDDEPFVRLSSLYVFPEARRAGIAGRTLTHLRRVLAQVGRGYRLDTCWSWQPTLRFYLRRAHWIRMWKRDLQLCWSPDTPAPRISVGASTATLSIVDGEREVELVRAERSGDVLGWSTLSYEQAKGTWVEPSYWLAESTLAVAIATEGWPLARSAQMLEEQRGGDAGPPEALANRLRWWEAWERDQGWIVSTPRIPGLTYPSWDELQREAEARWAAMLEERDGQLVVRAKRP